MRVPLNNPFKKLGGFGGALKLARSEAAPLSALVILAGGAALFIDLAEDMGEAEHQSLDESVLHWLHPGPNLAEPIGPAWLDHAMTDLTSLGSVAVLAVVAISVLGYLLFEKRWVQSALLVVSLAGGLVLSETMKMVFERSRPPEAYHAMGTLNASFPSGHALLATVAYLTLGAMLAQAMKKRRLKAYVIGWAVVLAMTVGVSRIYLGVHWTSDVLAGWSLGAAWAMACWLIERWLVWRLAPREATEEPPVGDMKAPSGD
jgi:undecaprenyl-diphosphatase